MTGPERSELADFKEEVRGELAALRLEMQPAIRLANAFAKAGEVFNDMGRFLKWGTGVGASIVSIAAGGKLLGLW